MTQVLSQTGQVYRLAGGGASSLATELTSKGPPPLHRTLDSPETLPHKTCHVAHLRRPTENVQSFALLHLLYLIDTRASGRSNLLFRNLTLAPSVQTLKHWHTHLLNVGARPRLLRRLWPRSMRASVTDLSTKAPSSSGPEVCSTNTAPAVAYSKEEVQGRSGAHSFVWGTTARSHFPRRRKNGRSKKCRPIRRFLHEGHRLVLSPTSNATITTAIRVSRALGISGYRNTLETRHESKHAFRFLRLSYEQTVGCHRVAELGVRFPFPRHTCLPFLPLCGNALHLKIGQSSKRSEVLSNNLLLLVRLVACFSQLVHEVRFFPKSRSHFCRVCFLDPATCPSVNQDEAN